MSTITETVVHTMKATTPMKPQPSGPRRLFKDESIKYGDFRDELFENGFVVVKGAVPRARADKYADDMMTYLETFKGGLGFKRDDPSTYKQEHLPVITEKGMIMGYGITHEDFTWAIRQEPGVIEPFEKVYDTKDLLVSFDAVNTTLPGRTDVKVNKPWPHQDQDPLNGGFRCLQGLVNLFPNGDDDGGLIVCKGAHRLSTEFHEEFCDDPNKVWSWTHEWYGFNDAGMAWLKNKGCKWIKVNAEPGDLILWDSRTPHYNVNATGNQPRFAVYTCFMPVCDASQEDLLRKKDAFEKTLCTTHWPNALHVGGKPILRDGKPCPYHTTKPRKPVSLSERGYRLTGIPYIKGTA